MYVRLPLETANLLLKHKNVAGMLRYIADGGRVTVKSVAEHAGVTRDVAREALGCLLRAELISKSGRYFLTTDKLTRDHVLINVRDIEVDALFRWRVTRKILYALSLKKDFRIRELAAASGYSYITVRKALSALRKAGVVVADSLNRELVYLPEDPIENIPRQYHRKAVRHFLVALKTYYPELSEPVVVFGEASQGWPSQEINVAILTRVAAPPERLAYLTDKLVLASSNATSQTGFSINLTITTEDACLSRLLNLTEPNKTIEDILEGICVHGKMPTPEDYFDLAQQAYPLSEEKIQLLLKKKYIAMKDGRYVHTEAGFRFLRRKKPSHFIDETLTLNGKTVHVIILAPPNVS